MKKVVLNIFLLVSSIRLLPHILLMLFSSKSEIIRLDLERWSTLRFHKKPVATAGFCMIFVKLMTLYPAYRLVFYHRFQHWSIKLLYVLCRPQSTMILRCPDSGPGLYVHEGVCSLIVAQKIGRNCYINQQVNVGYIDDTLPPIIGDNVSIHAGAKVFGNITIGDGAKIGANAVVVKNVPQNCTVVGVPAYIVRENGKKTKKSL